MKGRISVLIMETFVEDAESFQPSVPLKGGRFQNLSPYQAISRKER